MLIAAMIEHKIELSIRLQGDEVSLSEIRNQKSEICNPKSEIWNLKSEIWNLKSGIWNLESTISQPPESLTLSLAVHADGYGDGVYLVVVEAVGEGAGFFDELLVPAAGYEADAAFFGEGDPGEGPG